MVLVSRKPLVFRTAVNFHHECGAYQLRAVLNAFDKDASPKELYHSPSHRHRDWSLPWLMPRILAHHGIKAHLHFWLRGSFTRRILAALKREEPVLFVINSIILPGGSLHWISAWGYDETTDEFLCYDSKAPASEGTHGNTRYRADLLTNHLPWWGTFVLTIKTD